MSLMSWVERDQWKLFFVNTTIIVQIIRLPLAFIICCSLKGTVLANLILIFVF